MSKRSLTALTVASALVLAGCGGVGRSSGPEGAATLTTMGFGTGDEIAKTRVERANKVIAPATVRIGGNAFDAQQFLSAVASGSPPDLVYMDRQLLGTYAARGTVEPLDSCVAGQKIDLKQYRAPALAEVTLDGKLYGLPEFYNNRVLMTNASAAVNVSDRAGLERTVVELTKRAGDGKLARIGFDPKIPEFLPLWARANGVKMLSDDGKKANLDDPKLVEVLEYTVGLLDKQGGWGAVKAFRDSFNFFGEKNPFSLDQLAAFPMEDWYLNVLANMSPNMALGVTAFTDAQGRPIDWVTGSAWAIPAASKNKDRACAWIKEMTSSESWIAAAQARAGARKAEGKAFTGVYTANAVADQKIFGELVKLDDKPVFDKAVKAVLSAQESAFTMPASPAGSEFKTAWSDAVNRVLSGQQKAADALAQAQREAQQALDRASGGR
ncbi:ABC transporter substrate-binding protein [Allokutzneria albata]|uniref:Carbohydrate ABC transporter substrate-binding protein, CUT1 family n=1 Tax=Allokutzneria albata TaxID=211114 RepID=A0A1G9RT08_ALLAB|nr:extracellular solute-binding protein [Allokutzneria albata]SDM26351.1 carbohydrate ABC transporter substrate-binding protein, CUT1 family [Allokutzneria albata]